LAGICVSRPAISTGSGTGSIGVLTIELLPWPSIAEATAIALFGVWLRGLASRASSNDSRASLNCF
jgi:hypothetical protein